MDDVGWSLRAISQAYKALLSWFGVPFLTFNTITVSKIIVFHRGGKQTHPPSENSRYLGQHLSAKCEGFASSKHNYCGAMEEVRLNAGTNLPHLGMMLDLDLKRKGNRFFFIRCIMYGIHKMLSR